MAGRNNIHHPLPSAPASHTQERDFSTIFSNFQTLLEAFFPQQVHTDKPSDFFEKTLAIVHLEDVSSAVPRARALTLPAQCRLSLRLFCVVSGREAAHSVGRNAAKSSVNHLQNSVSSTCRLLTVWTFKYEHNSSVNMRIVCYSDAGSALNETNNTAKNTAYSRFLEQVRCILILSDDVAIINQDLRSIVRVIPG